LRVRAYVISEREEEKKKGGEERDISRRDKKRRRERTKKNVAIKYSKKETKSLRCDFVQMQFPNLDRRSDDIFYLAFFFKKIQPARAANDNCSRSKLKDYNGARRRRNHIQRPAYF
jgi:hypothetical protein